MPRVATIRSCRGMVFALLTTTILLAPLGWVKGVELQAESPIQAKQQPPVEPFVIQGRITAIQDAVVTVKTPDGYPGGRGAHAQFVTAGPTFRVDVSLARVLLPDGRQADRMPLAVGDRVLMVLTRPDSGPKAPSKVDHIYFASIVERVAQSDKIVTH